MIDMRVRNMFFDRPGVQRAVDKGKRKALAKAGAFVRQMAKQSIRKRKGPSQPGRPPHSHEGSLKRHIYFGYDTQRDSVVIGPARLTKSGDAPHILEFGGRSVAKRNMVVTVVKPGRRQRGRPVRGKRRFIKKGTRLVHLPRPYMGPALQKETPNIPNAFRGCVNDG